MPEPSDPNSGSYHDSSSTHSANEGATGRPPVDVPRSTVPPPPNYQPPPPNYQPPPPRQHGIVHRLAISLVTTVMLLSLALNVYFAVALYGQFKGGPREEVYREGDASHRITILPVEGLINATQADRIRRSLKSLDKHPPAALILRVSSGGGGVSASDQIWHQLTKFQAAHPDVPVVASFGAAAASGGYYVSAPSGWIVAEPTTTTGSIGVLAQVPTVEKLMDKLGVKWVTLEADGSPYKTRANNPFRTWTDKDVKVIKGLLNHAYEKFVDVVHQGRSNATGDSKGMTMQEVRQIAQGQIFTADEAKKKNVVDQIGYLDDALAKAKSMAKIDSEVTPKVTTIRVPGPFSLMSLITGQAHPPTRSQASLPTNPDQVRDWVDRMTNLRIQYRMSLP